MLSAQISQAWAHAVQHGMGTLLITDSLASPQRKYFHMAVPVSQLTGSRSTPQIWQLNAQIIKRACAPSSKAAVTKYHKSNVVAIVTDAISASGGVSHACRLAQASLQGLNGRASLQIG